MMMWHDVKLVLTVNDVLAVVPMSRTLLYEALKSGVLPSATVGESGKYLIAREALIEWLGLDTSEMLRDKNDPLLGAVPAATKSTSEAEVLR